MFSPRFYAHVRERTTRVSTRDLYFMWGMGSTIALLALPTFHNIGLIQLLHLSVFLAALILLVITPISVIALSYVLLCLPLGTDSSKELSRYAVVGVFNVFLNAAIFNSLIFVSGISQGIWVTGFALITFVIVITQSFFWNVFWTFRHIPVQNRKRQYLRFLLVTAATALVNLGIIQIFVNVIGAPAGISAALWANIALLFTIITAVIGNFFGYKFFVFRN